MLIEIKDIFGKVLYSSEALNIKECLKNAIKDNANLRNADLYNANLRNADLYNANLRNADLSNANLRNANLSNANLSNANLYNTNLYNTNLYNANLSNANLRNARFLETKIKDEIKINNKPIQITSNDYYIIIFDNHMQIGCEFHSFEEWFNYDNKMILSMDGKKALSFWNIWKEPLKQICKSVRNF